MYGKSILIFSLIVLLTCFAGIKEAASSVIDSHPACSSIKGSYVRDWPVVEGVLCASNERDAILKVDSETRKKACREEADRRIVLACDNGSKCSAPGSCRKGPLKLVSHKPGERLPFEVMNTDRTDDLCKDGNSYYSFKVRVRKCSAKQSCECVGGPSTP